MNNEEFKGLVKYYRKKSSYYTTRGHTYAHQELDLSNEMYLIAHVLDIVASDIERIISKEKSNG